MFQGEEELRAVKNRTLRIPTINVEVEQRDRNDRNDGRPRYAWRQELVGDYLQSDWSRMCAARTRAGMQIWLGWLALVLSLDQK